MSPGGMHGRRALPVWQWVFVGAIVLFGGVFSALAAVSNSPLIVGLIGGLVIAAFLLARLDLAIWLLLIGAFLVNGPITLAFPGLTKISWVLSLLGFFLLFGSVLKVTMSGDRQAPPLPGFIKVLLLLMFASVLVSLIVTREPLEAVVGLKRAFQFFGLMLALALMPPGSESERKWNQWFGFLVVVALLQLPASLFERIVLVPQRVGMWARGVVPLDIVAGTFEASLEGGGSSSVMVIFLVVVLAYFLAKWREKALSGGKLLGLVALLGAPLFLGETKIALILVPLAVFMVFRAQIRERPLQTAFLMSAGLVVTLALAWVYFAVLATGQQTASDQFAKALDYNFGRAGYYDRYGLNRTTAVTFWVREHGAHNPVETVFGHGLGSSYAGSGSLVPGHLNREYPMMAINLTSLSTLLWDTGIVGTLLYLGALVGAWRTAGRLAMRVGTGQAEAAARIVAIRVALASLFLSVLYSNSLVSSLSHEAIAAIMLGYLAWWWRAMTATAPIVETSVDRTPSLPHARAVPKFST